MGEPAKFRNVMNSSCFMSFLWRMLQNKMGGAGSEKEADEEEKQEKVKYFLSTAKLNTTCKSKLTF